jgi:hypothetical protein
LAASCFFAEVWSQFAMSYNGMSPRMSVPSLLPFNPLEHPVSLELPDWLDETGWAEHVPFAMYLISAMRPRSFVELGTFRGVSYCAFCQAVRSTGAATKCTAVDTWAGDAHAGTLEGGVFRDLKRYHDPLYSHFSELLRSTFDDALARFDDRSIDLLHIDGLHTYDAVRHDFESWLPKVSETGIVLFHDTQVRDSDFGVWKFWEEISRDNPSFEFVHGHGLGVLAIGRIVPQLEFLFNADDRGREVIRKYFHAMGDRVGAYERIRAMKHPPSLARRIRYVVREEGLGTFLKKKYAKLTGLNNFKS